MKNRFINFRLVLVALLCSCLLSSCLLDDDVRDFGQGANLVGFENSTYSLKVNATGEDILTEVPVKIIGPSVAKVKGPVTVTFSVDPSSTAVEGVNFILNSNSFVLTPDGSDDFTGNLPITIITSGIQPPLDQDPVLNLTIDSIANSDLVINDKTSKIAVTIGYECPFNINDYAGTYETTTDEFGVYIGEPKPFEVVAGPGENQITLVNFAAHPEMYDLVIDVDPTNGNLTIPKQEALNTNNIGDSSGVLSIEGSGSSGSASGNCIDHLQFTGIYSVAADSLGSFALGFDKIAGSDNGDTTNQ